MNEIFGLMLLAGLAGGLGHCSGMCGPLVIVFAPSQAGLGRSALLHAGRILSYVLLGGALAAVTHLLALETTAFPGRRVAAVVAGLVLLLGGLAASGIPWRRLAIFRPVPWPAVSRLAGELARSGGHFALGLVWGLLPCGLLYTAYAAAVAAGTEASNPALAWLRGAAVMLLFGAGTTPTLLGIGWAATQVPDRWRRVLQKVAAAVVAASGVILLYRVLEGAI